MKILLFSLNSSHAHTNLALRTLAAALERRGLSAFILERTEKDSRRGTLEALYEAKADVYGFSTYIWNYEAHLKLAENLKKLLPSSKILFGGPEVSFHGADWLAAHPYVDCLCRGEGEEALAAYCLGDQSERLLDGRASPDFCRAPVPYPTDIDYKGAILYYESARGCPFRCAYCLSARGETPAVRAKSAEDVLSDLLVFENMKGVRLIKLVDRTFNFDRRRAYAIWEGLLDSRYTKQYHFEICPFLLDDPTVALLARFPKDKIQFEIGVQSTNPRVLSAIDRTDDTETLLGRLEELFALGNIPLHADLIAGLPDEDYLSIAASYDALYGKCHQLQLGFLKLLKGTPLWTRTESYDYRFMAAPPYEVLSHRELSFSELSRLHRIEAVTERFVNSGRFYRAMAVLTAGRSPFGVMEAIADRLPPLAALSQREAYVSLLAAEDESEDFFEAKRLTLPDGTFLPLFQRPLLRRVLLREALAYDFLVNEQGRLPPALAFTPLTLSREEKRALVDAHPGLFLPALEGYDFPALGRQYFDRKNHRVYCLTKDATAL